MQTLDVLALDGWLLDYFTGKALGYDMKIGHTRNFEPCLRGEDLMPVLERMTTVLCMPGSGWQARVHGCQVFGEGPTVSIAVCRALVVATLGPAVQHPAPADDTCEDLFA